MNHTDRQEVKKELPYPTAVVKSGRRKLLFGRIQWPAATRRVQMAWLAG
jgi:hypothetical protein